MENQKPSHVQGIPVALIFFTVALICLIDVPMYFFGFAPLERAITPQYKTIHEIKRVPVVVTPTVAPTATPSALLRPVSRFTTVTPVTGEKGVVTVAPAK